MSVRPSRSARDSTSVQAYVTPHSANNDTGTATGDAEHLDTTSTLAHALVDLTKKISISIPSKLSKDAAASQRTQLAGLLANLIAGISSSNSSPTSATADSSSSSSSSLTLSPVPAPAPQEFVIKGKASEQTEDDAGANLLSSDAIFAATTFTTPADTAIEKAKWSAYGSACMVQPRAFDDLMKFADESLLLSGALKPEANYLLAVFIWSNACYVLPDVKTREAISKPASAKMTVNRLLKPQTAGQIACGLPKLVTNFAENSLLSQYIDMLSRLSEMTHVKEFHDSVQVSTKVYKNYKLYGFDDPFWKTGGAGEELAKTMRSASSVAQRVHKMFQTPLLAVMGLSDDVKRMCAPNSVLNNKSSLYQLARSLSTVTPVGFLSPSSSRPVIVATASNSSSEARSMTPSSSVNASHSSAPLAGASLASTASPRTPSNTSVSSSVAATSTSSRSSIENTDMLTAAYGIVVDQLVHVKSRIYSLELHNVPLWARVVNAELIGSTVLTITFSQQSDAVREKLLRVYESNDAAFAMQLEQHRAAKLVFQKLIREFGGDASVNDSPVQIERKIDGKISVQAPINTIFGSVAFAIYRSGFNIKVFITVIGSGVEVDDKEVSSSAPAAHVLTVQVRGGQRTELILPPMTSTSSAGVSTAATAASATAVAGANSATTSATSGANVNASVPTAITASATVASQRKRKSSSKVPPRPPAPADQSMERNNAAATGSNANATAADNSDELEAVGTSAAAGNEMAAAVPPALAPTKDAHGADASAVGFSFATALLNHKHGQPAKRARLAGAGTKSNNNTVASASAMDESSTSALSGVSDQGGGDAADSASNGAAALSDDIDVHMTSTLLAQPKGGGAHAQMPLSKPAPPPPAPRTQLVQHGGNGISTVTVAGAFSGSKHPTLRDLAISVSARLPVTVAKRNALFSMTACSICTETPGCKQQIIRCTSGGCGRIFHAKCLGIELGTVGGVGAATLVSACPYDRACMGVCGKQWNAIPSKLKVQASCTQCGCYSCRACTPAGASCGVCKRSQ